MAIRSNIHQRTSADVTIVRQGQANLVVPITPRSTRRFMLMQEDYIQLEFSLPTAERIAIGDYVNDAAVFGKFIVTEEQMPRYNQQTGGYDYSLKLEAEYRQWKTWINCLVVGGYRRDTRWNLTDRLSVHAQQVADNVNIIINPVVRQIVNQTTGDVTYTSTGYGISITADKAAEVHHIAYEGINIIEAMNRIAEAWQCEWWVTDDSVTIGDTTYAHTIHFGKCEQSVGISHSSVEDGAYIMRLGSNVESMDIARDQQTYATRIYAYGGTRNVPETYDKELIFEVTDNDVNGFKDANRPLSIGMIAGESSAVRTSIEMLNAATPTGDRYRLMSTHVYLTGEQTLSGNLSVIMSLTSRDWEALDGRPYVTAKLILHIGNDTSVIDESGELTAYEGDAGGNTMMWSYGVALNEHIDAGQNTEVYLEVEWTVSVVVADIDTASFNTNGSSVVAISGEATSTKQVFVTPYGDTTRYAATYYGVNGYIRFNDSVPTRWRVGSKYTLSPMNVNVDISYYTPQYEISGMSAVADRRIHLAGERYRDAVGASAIVEAVVIWEDEYPKLTLRIKAGSIWKDTKTDITKHDDGSLTREDWTQYSFRAEVSNDGGETWEDYDFDPAWIMDGCKLQAAFSAPTTSQSHGWMLGGMTFDVGYNRNLKMFTIIRNDDFGALLPNKIIKPSDEDEFVLVGWNPQAMADMGLIAASQSRLEDKVTEYLQSMQDGQFTITCRMMCSTMQSYPFCQPPYTYDGLRMYGLLSAGDKVVIYHDSLPGGSKKSRVIGYEYKLDMPYDTPTYIVGETEAYSRLKQIEKQLTKL